MAEVIKYSFSIAITGGPRLTYGAQLEVQAYDVLEFQVPENSGTATADVQPLNSGVHFLLVTAGSYEQLTYTVNGGSVQTLNAPLLLIGDGAVKLLGATAPTQFVFTNAAGVPNTVNILVGRDLTAP